MKFLWKSNSWISRIPALIFLISKNVFIWSKYIILQIIKRKVLSRLVLSVYSVNRSSSGLSFFDHSILWWLNPSDKKSDKLRHGHGQHTSGTSQAKCLFQKFENSRWISRSNIIKVAINWPLTLNESDFWHFLLHFVDLKKVFVNWCPTERLLSSCRVYTTLSCCIF